MLKQTSAFLFSILMVLTMSAPIYAAEEPSAWAAEEIIAARELNLIPEVLDSNYTQNIKRYEYVLIALQLLELNYDDIEIKQQYPFTDIYGHAYEEEIVAAYNAGIIKGDGNGKFRPNDTITRQEIASLVYNLVKRLRETDEMAITLRYVYSDSENIGSWAFQYINFCYENDVMKGIGKDNSGKTIINPLGNATIEQAILMLYRLGYNEGILKNYDLPSVSVKTGGVYEESSTINDFARVCGEELALKAIDLSLKENINIVYLQNNAISIDFDNEGTISIDKTNGVLSMDVIMVGYKDLSIITEALELAELVGASESYSSTFTRVLNGFESSENYYFQENISENEILGADVVNGFDGMFYRIRYMR